ncbi:uncharacterized protein LOC128223686 isoform X4 [Mya arenaria]|uniref:uncharacterized protein LOC128223686 isoform X4 n=1 Tax=Mya arenaria TaxID=6604 RepID=UPI0022E9018F|nr:uncharacterized protein LOC128223686 isoform X4 [Mya arenaria]
MNHAALFAFSVCYLYGYVQTNGEPCDEANQLGFLEKRVSGYTLAEDEDPICDFYLSSGWYSMGTYVISSQSITCGAIFSWYRTGELPADTAQGIVDLELCLTDGRDVCHDKITIKAKLCEDDRYVFKLVEVWGCPEAYCIELLDDSEVNGEPPNMTSINPIITPAVHNEAKTNTLRFYCTFDPHVEKAVLYKVTWAISLRNTLIDELTQKGPEQFSDTFNTSTMLTEHDMTAKSYGFGDTIVCIVRAMFKLNGNVSEPKTSPELFCGIEVDSDSSLTLVDTPLNQRKTAKLNLRLNIPFGCSPTRKRGCSLDVLLVQLDENKNCRFSSISAGDGRNYDMKCGGRILQNDIGKNVSVHIDLVTGDWKGSYKQEFHVSLHTGSHYHSFFQTKFLKILTIKALLETRQLRSAHCWSNNDPRMRTFDGTQFQHHDVGVWYLYINTEESLQVLIKTKQCRPGWGVTCNCGVVVNAGRDVFSISACETGHYFERKYTSCEDEKVLKITTSSSGLIDIILPTKTRVQVNPYRAPFLNVDIWASNADSNKPTGLCGYQDGNMFNDYTYLDGSRTSNVAAWRQSWRVPDDKNLFERVKNLTPWPGQKRFCSCTNTNGDISKNIICSAVGPTFCYVHGNEDQFDRCFTTRLTRRKRSVNSGESDTHESAVTSMDLSETEFDLTPLTGITFDNATAWAYCEDAFNITVLRICSQLKNFTQTDYLQNCVDDILAIDDTVFTPSYVDLQKKKCYSMMNASIPPPAEDFNNITLVVDGKEIENVTDVIIQDSLEPEYTMEVLNEIVINDCPQECYGRGDCNNGTCECYKGFTSIDCSVDLSKPVTMYGIPDRGYCDLKYRPCERTSVFGTNIANTVKCFLKHFWVTNTSFTYTEFTFETEGYMLAPDEIKCLLPPAGPTIPDGFLALGYNISLSNDGDLYSVDDIIVVHDSDCVQCTRIGTEVICERIDGSCMRDGLCYVQGEYIGCSECSSELGGNVTWIYQCALAGCNPCLNNATCINGYEGYSCMCADGWNGTHCEQNIDECESNPCVNDGTCIDGVNGYTCACKDGWEGPNCELDIDDCLSNPCQNNGSCEDGLNTYTCKCAGGFDGTHCENEIPSCDGEPCQNGATCHDMADGYSCTCAVGFSGHSVK